MCGQQQLIYIYLLCFGVVCLELGHQTVAGNRLYLTRIYSPDGADVTITWPYHMFESNLLHIHTRILKGKKRMYIRILHIYICAYVNGEWRQYKISEAAWVVRLENVRDEAWTRCFIYHPINDV